MPLVPLRSAVVTAPSRLHFGMFSFGQPGVRQFGGVGVMVESPPVRVAIQPADAFAVSGFHAERAARFARSVLANLQRDQALPGEASALPVHVTVEQAPRQHIGLGLGTQLGLSVAAAIGAACDLPRPPAITLARLVGRGGRSAVGTHGFDHGGLLVEPGKLAADEISPLLARMELPSEWRFLLIIPKSASGLAGGDEQMAFERLPPVASETTDRLLREAMLHLLPSAAAGNFAEFAESLYRFGHLAGSCFSPQQGGPFADERTAQIVERLRRMGVAGVGQSSWGPTVFALCESEDAAHDLLRQVQPWAEAGDYECLISAPANHGALTEVLRED